MLLCNYIKGDEFMKLVLKSNNFASCFVLFSILFLLISCVSIKRIDPNAIQYKEITANDFAMMDISSLFTNEQGCKVTSVFLSGYVWDDSEIGFLLYEHKMKKIRFSNYRNDLERYTVDATEFVEKTLEKDPYYFERIYSVSENDHFNGHYVLYLYKDGDRIKLYNIEGVPSQVQIDKDKNERELAEKKAKEEKEAAEKAREAAEKKAREEKIARKNSLGKSIAKGYTYHGVDEVKTNQKLLANNALEPDHAYYISGFAVKYGGSMAVIDYGSDYVYSTDFGRFYWKENKTDAFSIDYINVQVKAEVVKASVGSGDSHPVEVIVAGVKDSWRNPVVLGLIKE